MDGPCLAILIPAYCEARTIEAVVRRASAYGAVVVADDCSSDDTAALASEAGAIVVSNPVNLGYDGNLSRGFEEAAARGFTHVITIDADGEHDPATIADFSKCLIEEKVPLVLGVRPHKQRIAEVVMGWYVRARFGPHDILCGMKGYDLALWHANGGFDHTGSIGTELAINAMRRGAGFREIPVAGTRREDAPRFDRRWRANKRILGALMQIIRDDLGASRKR